MPLLRCRTFIPLCLFVLAFWARAAPAPSIKDAPEHLRFFSLLYTGGRHGHITQDAKTMGLARIAAYKEALPSALLLDSGDFLHGAPFATHSQGRDIVRLMKLAGYFAAAAGNHEFDYLPGVLHNRREEAMEPPGLLHIVSANVRTESGIPGPEAEAEITLDGVKICLFGLTASETPLLAHEANTDISAYAGKSPGRIIFINSP